MKPVHDNDNTAIIAFMLVLSLVFYITSVLYPILLNKGFSTSLKPSELLIVASLTITFYSIFEQSIKKELSPKINYKHVNEFIRTFTFFNIIFVSIGIILILISTTGIFNLTNAGFIILVSSWFINLILISTIALTIAILKVSVKSIIRDICLWICFIGALILIILAVYNIIKFKLFF